LADRVLLVGVVTPVSSRKVIEEHLAELQLLVKTLDYEVADQFIVNRKIFDPATYIGKGKIEEIKSLVTLHDIQDVIFDDDISPTQARNIARIIDREVVDRSGIIIEIFAKHARTKEARTQIDLAMLQYLLPRLAGRWTHLERQVGGIGVRGGAGESQIEVDRRLIRTRISKLKRELEKIDGERKVRSKGRGHDFNVSLVGYTNAGKSTLLNALTGSDVLAEDKLFATLDTTVRRCRIDNDHQVLLSDTVGFIRKLPAKLVASFRGTLMELEEADLLIKIVDLSSEQCFYQLRAVDEQLQQINLHTKPSLIVFNKIDVINELNLKQARRDYPDAVFISAQSQLRLNTLKEAILTELQKEMVDVRVQMPLREARAISILRNHTAILEESYEDGKVQIHLTSYRRVWNWLESQLGSVMEIRPEGD